MGCLVSDGVRELYLNSQNSMKRSELDGRNTINFMCSFHEKMVLLFNNRDYVPTSRKLPELHVDFKDERELHLGEFRLTFDRSKQMLVDIKPMLYQLINNYEASGNGEGQRDTSSNDCGTFDISLCSNGDDRKNFLCDNKHTYLLYFWHLLDVEGLVQFTCVKLPSFMTANSKSFSLVSREVRKKKKEKEKSPIKNEIGDKLMQQLGKLGKGVENLAEVAFNQEIESNNESILRYEFEILDLDPNMDNNKRKIALLQRRIDSLRDDVKNKKRKLIENVR